MEFKIKSLMGLNTKTSVLCPLIISQAKRGRYRHPFQLSMASGQPAAQRLDLIGVQISGMNLGVLGAVSCLISDNNCSYLSLCISVGHLMEMEMPRFGKKKLQLPV